MFEAHAFKEVFVVGDVQLYIRLRIWEVPSRWGEHGGGKEKSAFGNNNKF